MPEETELLKALEQERAALARMGYEFPALFAAVEYLLKKQMPE
jgi:hypothetical protein